MSFDEEQAIRKHFKKLRLPEHFADRHIADLKRLALKRRKRLVKVDPRSREIIQHKSNRPSLSLFGSSLNFE